MMAACVTRAAFVAQALAYVGTPYVHQARVPGHGMDCVAVPLLAARALGLVQAAFDITGYGPVPDGDSLRRGCEQYMQPIDWAAAREGDVLLCSWQHGPPQHLGVLVERNDAAGRHYWVHANGNPGAGIGTGAQAGGRHQVRRSRLAFGDRLMQLVACYHVPGVEA
jgi:cell wall-associated NlpC family hydrolase